MKKKYNNFLLLNYFISFVSFLQLLNTIQFPPDPSINEMVNRCAISATISWRVEVNEKCSAGNRNGKNFIHKKSKSNESRKKVAHANRWSFH